MAKRRFPDLLILIAVGAIAASGLLTASAFGCGEDHSMAGHQSGSHKQHHGHQGSSAKRHGKTSRSGSKRSAGRSARRSSQTRLQYPPKPVRNGNRLSYAILNPAVPGGPKGLIALRQRGNRLTGELVVHGLAPGAVHAAHVHGPRGGCGAGQFTGRHAAEFPDLVANGNGVATQRFSVKVGEQVLGHRGYFVMVHRDSTPPGQHHHMMGGPIPTSNPAGPSNPAIGCAEIS